MAHRGSRHPLAWYVVLCVPRTQGLAVKGSAKCVVDLDLVSDEVPRDLVCAEWGGEKERC